MGRTRSGITRPTRTGISSPKTSRIWQRNWAFSGCRCSGRLNKPGQFAQQNLRRVDAHGVTAVLDDEQTRSSDQTGDLLGKFRWANPVVPAGQYQRGRGDAGKLGAQVE